MKLTLTVESSLDLGPIFVMLTALERSGYASDDFLVAIDRVKQVAIDLISVNGSPAEPAIAPVPIAAEPEKKKVGRPKKVEPASTGFMGSAEEPELFTLDDIKNALKTIPDARTKAKAALEKFKREKISDLKPDEISRFMVEIAGAA